MGAENLIPMNKRTKDEQKAIATKGGIKSGQVRRRKRDMRELCNEILNTVVTDEELADKLIKAGVDDTYGGLMLFRAIQGAHESPQMLDKVLTLAGYNCQRIEQVIDDKRDWPDRIRLVFDDGENLYDTKGNIVTEEEFAGEGDE
jgi:hypothetical protein